MKEFNFDTVVWVKNKRAQMIQVTVINELGREETITFKPMERKPIIESYIAQDDFQSKLSTDKYGNHILKLMPSPS